MPIMMARGSMTRRRLRVLRAVEVLALKSGGSPTWREVAEYLGRSKRVVAWQLMYLRSIGLLKSGKNKERSLALTDAGRDCAWSLWLWSGR